MFYVKMGVLIFMDNMFIYTGSLLLFLISKSDFSVHRFSLSV